MGLSIAIWADPTRFCSRTLCNPVQFCELSGACLKCDPMGFQKTPDASF